MTWITHTRPAIAMSYSYVNPVIAVFVGAVLGAEQLGPNTLIATGLIVAATVAMVGSKAKAAPPPQPVLLIKAAR